MQLTNLRPLALSVNDLIILLKTIIFVQIPRLTIQYSRVSHCAPTCRTLIGTAVIISSLEEVAPLD